jgi:hypothetical protein
VAIELLPVVRPCKAHRVLTSPRAVKGFGWPGTALLLALGCVACLHPDMWFERSVVAQLCWLR